MSVAYKDVLERFVKYREQRNISQNELAQMLRISQSYVSKMEVGKARISFEILTALYQQGWDIDYIITGQENHRTESRFFAVYGLDSASGHQKL